MSHQQQQFKRGSAHQNGSADGQKARDRDPGFAELFKSHRPQLIGHVTSMTRDRHAAEDLTATAFAKAYEKLGTFRHESSIVTWLHAIARNEVLNRSRRERCLAWTSIDAPDAAEFVEPDLLAQTLERQECCARLRRVLRRIPALYRTPLVDHFVRDRSIRQISRRRKIPVGTVLSRIFAAKRILRKAWEATA